MQSKEIEYMETPEGDIYIQSRRVNYLSEWARKIIIEKAFTDKRQVFIASSTRWAVLTQTLPVKKKII